jgi:hypothetical protein
MYIECESVVGVLPLIGKTGDDGFGRTNRLELSRRPVVFGMLLSTSPRLDREPSRPKSSQHPDTQITNV